MSKQIFPPEIIEYSVESLFYKHDKRSNIIYNIIICSLILFAIATPYIKVEISSQSRGIIRSAIDENPLVTPAAGFIEYLSIGDNTEVKKGDTLIIIESENLDWQKRTLNERLRKLKTEKIDIEYLLMNKA